MLVRFQSDSKIGTDKFITKVQQFKINGEECHDKG